MNHFELFDIPASPVVQKKIITEKYHLIQRQTHPDFHTQATEDEKEAALNRSSQANEAYAIFSNSQRTLEYYLWEMGEIKEGESYALPSAFLMEMMELNEELESLDNIESRKKITTIIEQISGGVADWLEGRKVPDKQGLEMMKEYYYKKKYIDRILERLGD
jgi:molecular chaperone HscB